MATFSPEHLPYALRPWAGVPTLSDFDCFIG
jgi:hypothetical protein